MGGLDLWWRDENWHTGRIDHVYVACKITSLALHAFGIQTPYGLTGKVPAYAGNKKIPQGLKVTKNEEFELNVISFIVSIHFIIVIIIVINFSLYSEIIWIICAWYKTIINEP